MRRVNSFIGSPVFTAFLDAPFLVIFLIVLFMLHWVLFLIVLAGGAALVIVAVISQALTARMHQRSLSGLGEAHAEHVIHQFVTDQATGQHRPFRLEPEGGTCGNFSAQQVAGGDCGNFEPLRNKPGLRSLTAARWTKKQNNQFLD